MKQTLLILFLLLAIQSFSQDIVTDRPDQTESATSLPKGFFQLETGTQLEVVGGARNWTINTNLFRYGVVKNLELRLVTEISRQKFDGSDWTSVGIEDMQVGFKYQFLEKKGVEMALLSHLVIPSGSEKQSAGTTGSSSRINLSHGITDNIGVGYNLGYEYFTKEQHGLVYTLAVGFGLTEKIGFYAEIFGDSYKFDTFTLSYDNGFTYLVKPNLQLDFTLGLGITERYNYYAAGLSWRLPD